MAKTNHDIRRLNVGIDSADQREEDVRRVKQIMTSAGWTWL